MRKPIAKKLENLDDALRDLRIELQRDRDDERTCRIEVRFDHYECEVFKLSCGHECCISNDELNNFCYCYQCGARVVE